MITDFCVKCGTKERLQTHHWVPRALGGSDDPTNLITLCEECHNIAVHGNLNYRIGQISHRKLCEIGRRKNAWKKFPRNRIPFGCRVNEKERLELDPAQFKIIKKMLDYYDSGLTYKQITAKLKRYKHYNQKGKAWTRADVMRLCRIYGAIQRDCGSDDGPQYPLLHRFSTEHPLDEIDTIICDGLANGTPQREIADKLNKGGFRTSCGSRWATKNVEHAVARIRREGRPTYMLHSRDIQHVDIIGEL